MRLSLMSASHISQLRMHDRIDLVLTRFQVLTRQRVVQKSPNLDHVGRVLSGPPHPSQVAGTKCDFVIG